jgi:hypothetical protein
MPTGDTTDASTPARPYRNLCLFLILASVGLAGYFYWQKSLSLKELVPLQGKIDSLKQEVTEYAIRRKHTDKMITLLRDTDTRSVKLSNGKSSNIVVFHNDLRKECALDVSGVPVPNPGRYLQVWARIKNEPISLGMVKMDALAGFQPLEYHENVESYEISEDESPNGNSRPAIVIAFGKM